jgi:hypothetical protein
MSEAIQRMKVPQRIVDAAAELQAEVAKSKDKQLLKMELLQQSECANLALVKKILVPLVSRNLISGASAETETEIETEIEIGTEITLVRITTIDAQR